MRMNAPVRRWTSWLLLLAFLNAMAVPVWAGASGNQAAARTVLMQLCHAGGSQLVEVEVENDLSDASSVAASVQDGFCLLCFYSATPPDTAAPSSWQPVAHTCAHWVVDDAPAPLAFLWSPARARAPPVIS